MTSHFLVPLTTQKSKKTTPVKVGSAHEIAHSKKAVSMMSLLLVNHSARLVSRLSRQSRTISAAGLKPTLLVRPLRQRTSSRCFATVQEAKPEISSAEILFPRASASSSDTDNEKDRPQFDTCIHPLNALKQHFLNTKQVEISNERHFGYKHYEISDQTGQKVLCWVADFCYDKEHAPFSSGILKKTKKYLYSPATERCYYFKKTTAREAAAGHYLDTISKGEKYCVKPPSLTKILINHYKTKHNISLPDEFCEITRRDDLWHAEFTCPVTKKAYPSGILVGAENDVQVDSKVYYSRKYTAMLAAVAKAVDDLTGSTFCQLATENVPETKNFVDVLELTYGDVVFTEGDDTYILSEGENKEGIVVDSNDNSSEKLIIARVPDVVRVTPARRLLELASGTYRSRSSISHQSSFAPAGIDEPRSAVATARSWTASLLESLRGTTSDEKRNLHRLCLPKHDSGVFLLRGNAILASLAEATQSSPIGFSFGAQEAAVEVIDALWQTENSKPDVESYNLYLKCLDDTHGRSSVRKAETTINSMRRGACYKSGNNLLPKPNRDTINALIQLSAQLGGSAGRHAKYTETGFVPNKESFLSVLSSSIYRPVDGYEAGGFDPDFARSCIQKMSELADETADPALKPDTQVYNAPLRWSGGPELWRESRPYARYCPWDIYEHVFAAGVRDNNTGEDDLRVKEAIITEQWLNHMETACVSNSLIAPDIETYEAAIQSWLRTATRRGLECAESLLKRVLDSSARSEGYIPSVSPRLQTFHPIIAAWRHSKEPDGPAKVYEWTTKWEMTDAAQNSLPDPRIVDLQLESRLSHQESQQEIISKGSLSEKEAAQFEIVSAAQDCSRILEELLDRIDGGTQRDAGDFKLDASLFSRAVQAWQNVACSCTDNYVDQALFEAAGVLDTFQNLVQAIGTTQFPNGVLIVGTQGISPRLEHLVSNSQQLCCSMLAFLTSLNEKTEPLSAQQTQQCLLLVEKMVRMTGEFQAIETFLETLRLQKEEINARTDIPKRDASPVDPATILPVDRFVYGVKEHVRPTPSKLLFLLLATRFLDKVDISSEYDIVRLCALIEGISVGNNSEGPSHPRLQESINSVLSRVVTRYGQDRDGIENPGVHKTTTRTTPAVGMNPLSEASRQSRSVRERRKRGGKRRSFRTVQ